MPIETILTLVLGIIVIAYLLKWFAKGAKEDEPAESADQVDRLLAEVSGAEPRTAGEVAAITSDGWSFIPDGHEVVMMPPRAGTDSPTAHIIDASQMGPARIDIGDLIGVRVVRGAPDFDPWRLEGLGRDGDYRAWFFENEEAARAARDLLERRVVRVPVDADGDPHPPRDQDFEQARKLDEETEQSLDHSED